MGSSSRGDFGAVLMFLVMSQCVYKMSLRVHGQTGPS